MPVNFGCPHRGKPGGQGRRCLGRRKQSLTANEGAKVGFTALCFRQEEAGAGTGLGSAACSWAVNLERDAAP